MADGGHFDTDHQPLPSRAQLQAIGDRAALEAIREAIADRVTRIETDLEFRPGDADWQARARSALFHHRRALRLTGERLREVRTAAQGKPSSTGRRRPEDCHPLTNSLFDGFSIDAGGLATLDLVAAARADLDLRIEALQLDRADENDRLTERKDMTWLQRAKVALTRARNERAALDAREAELRTQEREARKAATPSRREQLFVDAAREVLARDDFEAVWAVVDRIQAAERAAAERTQEAAHG